LLLKPRQKGVFEPLPWFTFVPMGAWLGHKIGIFVGKPIVASALAIVEAWTPLSTENWPLPALQFWCPIIVGALAALVLALTLGKAINVLLGWSFRVFNVGFDASTTAYTRSVSGLLRLSVPVLAVYGGLLALTYWGFTHTPTGFIPQQDKG